MSAEGDSAEFPFGRILQLAGVALAFAVCGALSLFFPTVLPPQLYSPNAPVSMDGMLPMGVPFALLSAALFLRSWRAIISVLLNVAVWWCIAVFTAVTVIHRLGLHGDESHLPYI